MDKSIYNILAVIICSSFFGIAQGQSSKQIIWISSDQDKKVMIQEKLWETEYELPVVKSTLTEVERHLHSKGYLLTKVKQINDSSATIHVGNKYYWANLNPGNIDQQILHESGYASKMFLKRAFNYHQAARLLNNIITTSERHGFPFASVTLDSVNIEDNKLSASLYYEAGPRILYDSMQIIGNSRLNSSFLSAYLKIKPGAPFNQKEVDEVQEKLNQLSYIKQLKPVEILFANEKAELRLALDKLPSNHIDGVIGFLPGENQSNGLLITGQLDLALNNLFGTGKKIKVNWQAIEPLSQTFDFNYHHPAVFRGPIDLNFNLNFLKEDTTFFNQSFSSEAELFLNSSWKASLIGSYKKGGLLSTIQYQSTTELPEILDYDIKEYGLALSYSKLNSHFSPTMGWKGKINVGIGSKRIFKNQGIEESLYSEINLNSTLYRLNFELDKYTSISKNWVVFARLTTAHIFNDNLILNELYRVGGLNSLRGFNQNEFFAAQLAILVTELRLYFENRSYLFAFYDQGIIHYNLSNSSLDDQPLGFGIGLQLNTGNGDFKFAYALGHTDSQPISFNLSKIHFGYIAKF